MRLHDVLLENGTNNCVGGRGGAKGGAGVALVPPLCTGKGLAPPL